VLIPQEPEEPEEPEDDPKEIEGMSGAEDNKIVHVRRMVNTRNGRGDPKPAHPNWNSPPPLTLAQAIASILESCDEQTELLRQLVGNSARGGHGARNAPALAPTTYGDFAATHPPLSIEVGEPLEADHWHWVIESKFGLLHYTEVQKTLFAAQQLRSDTSTWWANYTVTHPTDYQVSWTKFHSAFRAHHIPAGVMRKKRREFMDLKQGGRSVHHYSKLFNHLAHMHQTRWTPMTRRRTAS
jgi:hypothetical protein